MNHRTSGGGGQDAPADTRPTKNDNTQGDDQGGKETIPDAAPAHSDDA
jgi:hypothetical protein